MMWHAFVFISLSLLACGSEGWVATPVRLTGRSIKLHRRLLRHVGSKEDLGVAYEKTFNSESPLPIERYSAEEEKEIETRPLSKWLDATTGLVVVVYALQGSLSLARLATNYYLKDELGLSVAELGALTGVFSAPWVIKPLYGLASDSLPIWGSRRASYLLLSGLTGCVSFLALACAPNKAVVVLANVVASASVAVSDVVADSLVVEQSRTEGRASELQSVAWASRYVGAICASLASGPALRAWGARGAWLATAPLPLLVAGASRLVEEPPLRDERLNLRAEFATTFSALRSALASPAILRPAIFIFLWQATPSCGSAFFVFSTAPEPNGLGFDPDFLGSASAASSLAGLVGVAAYNRFYKDAPLSQVIKWTSLASAFIGCAPLILVARINRDFGIPDKLFALGDDVVQSALGEIGFLPVLVLAARITPPGVEGVLFAALMSLFNLGGIVSQELGALLASIFHVSQSDFSNLPLLICLCSTSSALPLLCLNWVRQAERRSSDRPGGPF